MVGTSVNAVDDGVGGAFQLVMQAALHQPAEDGLSGLVAEARRRGRLARVVTCSSPGASS